MFKKSILFVLVLIVSLYNVNCGKKGPLKLEPEILPGMAKNIKVSQMGNNIRLKWDFPRKLSDKKTDLDITNITRIEIRYSPKEILDGKFRKKSTLLRKLTMAQVSPYSRETVVAKNPNQAAFKKKKKNEPLSFFTDIPFEIKDLTAKPHFLALRYFYGKKKSPISKVVSMVTLTPVNPIEGLNVTIENKLIKLVWNKPQVDAAGVAITNIGGYKIFKKVIPPKTEPKAESETETGETEETPAAEAEPEVEEEDKEFRRINFNKVLTEYFEDFDTGRDGEYQYYVSALLSGEIESAPSPIVSVNVTDIFAPEIPMNLVGFRASDHMFLTWRAVPDKDVSHYRIYGKTSEEGEYVLISDNITTTQYKDTSVQKGILYFYVVTAVDTKGNESDYSQSVKEEF